MEFSVKIKMNDKLFLKDPEQSEIGRKIVKEGLELIVKLGFEDFTFKKLATHIQTTEATVYRYFENKHKLLIYLFSWYWSYQEYKIRYRLNNVKNNEIKIKSIIELLLNPDKDILITSNISEKSLHELVISEGSKSYLSKNISTYNKNKLFKSYKDLSGLFASILLEYNANYKYPHSLATTILEISHSQQFFSKNLPSLTDFNSDNDTTLSGFLETIVFSSLKPGRNTTEKTK